MSHRSITITSKSQITLPADLVRKYNLDRNRIMVVSERNGSIVLTPQPSLEELMRKHWDYYRQTHPDATPPANAQMHSEVRDAYQQH